MLNKQYSVKFSDLSVVKGLAPEATMTEVFDIAKKGPVNDLVMCKTVFPALEIKDINTIVNSRRFVRWFANNKKAVAISMVGVPAFAFAMYKLQPGEFLAKLITDQAATTGGLGEIMTEFRSFQEHGEPAISALAPMAADGGAGEAVPTSFFGGKGAILLHMLVVGFFTLVVSSFLKFTGRGDFIPLVAFVGGGIILYEVIGLFQDIYGSISTLLNM